jgi:hypothetical protein
MFAYLSHCRTRPRTATRVRRITAALAVVTAGLLIPAAAVPAAFAAVKVIPDPGGGAYGPFPAVPGGTVQVIAVGGMPGWQITVMALAAALIAATAAVLLDRARASHRAASAAR